MTVDGRGYAGERAVWLFCEDITPFLGCSWFLGETPCLPSSKGTYLLSVLRAMSSDSPEKAVAVNSHHFSSGKGVLQREE